LHANEQTTHRSLTVSIPEKMFVLQLEYPENMLLQGSVEHFLIHSKKLCPFFTSGYSSV